ncbi:hypothetical protein K2D_05300 [Planctomycetes bacterium K2D]|nr:hypothetical protein K2D_05300 [Planctomycetes bacterium K2D]
MRPIALRVATALVFAFCVLDMGYAIWDFFKHDGVAFYAEQPVRGAFVVLIAVASGVIWHLAFDSEALCHR